MSDFQPRPQWRSNNANSDGRHCRFDPFEAFAAFLGSTEIANSQGGAADWRPLYVTRRAGGSVSVKDSVPVRYLVREGFSANC